MSIKTSTNSPSSRSYVHLKSIENYMSIRTCFANQTGNFCALPVLGMGGIGLSLPDTNLSSEQINFIKSTVMKTTIPAGTILYRSQTVDCSTDEGKIKDVYA